MPGKKNAGIYIKHITDELNFLQAIPQNKNMKDVRTDPVLKRAVERSLEIIGEAVKQLPESYKKKHPEIEWKKLAGLRDKIVHHYFGIDWVIVWDVIKNKVPELKNKISVVSGDADLLF